MPVPKCETSRCGLCRFYDHEGRRGGRCSRFNVPVDSRWKACELAASPFSNSAESVVGIAKWPSSKRFEEKEISVVSSVATLA